MIILTAIYKLLREGENTQNILDVASGEGKEI